MALLIDGYNLLHVTGIFGRGKGPGGFERSRLALVRFLVASLREQDLRDATIVFDAAEAPPGLPSATACDGLKVRYAQGYPDADTLLEELIAQHHAPRTLTVVSSDHRVQRAARRRRAQPIDSDRWYAELLKERRNSVRSPMVDATKAGAIPEPAEVAYWLRQFADSPEGPLAEAPPEGTMSNDIDPFPPGYADDLSNKSD